MATNNFDVEILLLQIEDLFERFRNLSHDARELILEKIRVKLLEEFKDFIIQENDLNQETIFEVSFGDATENLKLKDFTELPNATDNCDSILVVNSKDDDLLSLLQSESTDQFEERIEDKSLKSDVILLVKNQNESNGHESFPIMCNYCGKQFCRKNLFKYHLERHKNERVYECATCSLQFNVKDDLVKHMKSHSIVRNFVCPICAKPLVNNTTLRNHIQVMHRKEEKYCCNKCDYFAYSKHTLKEHIRIKHEKQFQRYACIICKKVFPSKVLLKVHLRSHTGEKPYKCQDCDSAFVCSGRLTNHKNSVHGERKHACEICNKSFKTPCKLKRHSYVHTRIKPFACPFCANYASNTQGNLTKHVKTVHQMNGFSFLKYKKMIQGELEDVKEEWIKNAESCTNEYLKKLSDRSGTVFNIEELKEQYSRNTPNNPALDKQNVSKFDVD